MPLKQSTSDAPSPFTLRVFSDDSDSSPIPPAELTLRALFDRYLRPTLDAPERKGSLEAYVQAIGHFERRTGNPPAAQIDNTALLELRRSMERDGYAAQTIAKTGRHLRALLRRIGPATDGNPAGLGVLPKVPYFEMPRCPRLVPRLATFEELSALYEVAPLATWPVIPEVSPGAFWRAVLVCFYNLGPRAWELFCESPKGEVDRKSRPSPAWPGWRWEFCELLGSARESGAGTLEYWIPKVSAWHSVPLNRMVVAHLQAMRSDRRAIFPATKAHGSVYGQWRCLKAAAHALRGNQVQGIEDLDFHNIRKTCQTEWDTLKMGLGDHIVWHTPTDVGGMHYRNFARLARQHCEDLPQPEAFQTIFEDPHGAKQLHLF